MIDKGEGWNGSLGLAYVYLYIGVVRDFGKIMCTLLYIYIYIYHRILNIVPSIPNTLYIGCIIAYIYRMDKQDLIV